MSRRSWIMLMLLASLWGASYLFIKVALEDLSPAMIVLLRTALAALVLVPLATSRRGLRTLRGGAGVVLAVAAVQVAAPFLLISAGEQEISSSLTGILVASSPLFIALLAVWLDQEERSSGWGLVGVVAGFVGVAVLIGVNLVGDLGALLGGAAVLLASLGYAVGGFVVKRSSAKLDPLGLAAGSMVVATVLVAPIAIPSAPTELPSAATLGSIAMLGLGGTGVAFALFHTLIANEGPARAMLVSYIAPVFAVLYGAALLGEAVTVATIVGLMLIVGGSWLGAGRGTRPRPAEDDADDRSGRPGVERARRAPELAGRAA